MSLQNRPKKESDILAHCQNVQDFFVKNKIKLGIAESCTGGLLSSFITALPGSSKYFEGAIVSYSGAIKEALLSVPKHTMQSLGQVSEPVALAMARGAKEQLMTQWAVSITGIAGPTGGSVDKPVGTVCFAVVGPGFARSVTKRFESRERTQIQWEAANFALEILIGATQGKIN